MLIGNGSRYLSNPMRLFNGVIGYSDLQKPGILVASTRMNQATIFGATSSIPAGSRPQESWRMPIKTGSDPYWSIMSSHNSGTATLTATATFHGLIAGSSTLTLTPTGSVVAKMPIAGVTTITVDSTTSSIMSFGILVSTPAAMSLTADAYAEGIGYFDLSGTTISITADGSGVSAITAVGSSIISLTIDGSIGSLLPVAGDSTFTVTGNAAIVAPGPMVSDLTTITLDALANVIGIGHFDVSQTTITITASGDGTCGVGISGSSLFTVLASGDIFSEMFVVGQGTVTITASMIVGAVGWLVGNSVETLDGDLTGLGLGWMVGSTVVPSVQLTAAECASAVWAEVLEADPATNMTASDLVRLLASISVGSATGMDGPIAQFRSLDGKKTRVRAFIEDGVRTVTARNGK